MAAFLSQEWIESLSTTLRAAGPVPLGPVPLGREDAVLRVVVELSGAPANLPHALTFTLTSDAASVAVGDHLLADALIRLSYEDAVALASGTLESSEALRAGRIKVRGDVNAIVPLLEWLQQAHPGA